MIIPVTSIIVFVVLILVWKMNPAEGPAELKNEEAAVPVIPIDSTSTVPMKNSVVTNDEPVTKRNSEQPSLKEQNVAPVNASTDSAKIFLTSTPWAKVYVNNQFIGETPIGKPVMLTAGTHSVMFTNPSFDPIVKMVTVESNREQTVSGNFLEQTGYVRVNVRPWAEIYVEDQYKETTPLSRPMMLSAGKHTFRFKNASFPDIVKEVMVNAKDTVQLTVEFTK